MKAKREHRVPLCVQALEILNAARTLDESNRLVFPMPSGKAISMSTLSKMLEYHRIAAVPHGFRSSFRDWSAERTDHPAGGDRGGAGARGPEQGGGCVCALGPVRTAPAADGRLDALPDRAAVAVADGAVAG